MKSQQLTPKMAITKQIELLRKYYSLGIYPEYIEKLCNECDIESFKFACNNSLAYEQIHLTNFGFNEPFHRCSLIGFFKNNIIEWFLIDPTYGQFFEDENFKNYMFSYHNDFSIKLLNQGFIEFSIENLLSYLDSFIANYEVNSTMLHQNIITLLKNMNININNIDLQNIDDIIQRKKTK